MIPLWVTVFAFAAVAYITKSRTYAILAFSALVNVYIDHFTHADDPYLMVTYSTIEFCTAIGVIYFGDIHKLYQSSMLALFLCAHFMMEFALVYDFTAIIYSNIYINTISILILAQLIGAGRGLDRGQSRVAYNWRKNHHFSIFDY